MAEDPGFAQADAQLEIVTAAEVVSTTDRTQVTTFGVQADEAVAVATGQANVAVRAAMTASILDVAALDSERITQAAGNVAGQELGTLTGITTPPLAALTALINIVIIIP